jgi:hypothetical protein
MFKNKCDLVKYEINRLSVRVKNEIKHIDYDEIKKVREINKKDKKLLNTEELNLINDISSSAVYAILNLSKDAIKSIKVPSRLDKICKKPVKKSVKKSTESDVSSEEIKKTPKKAIKKIIKKIIRTDTTKISDENLSKLFKELKILKKHYKPDKKVEIKKVVVEKKTLPSDLSPFKDFVYGIKPNLLKKVKNDYDLIIDMVYKMLSVQKNQTNSINNFNSSSIFGLILTSVMNTIQKLSKNYTTSELTILVEYFFQQTILDFLNNYYTGPNINLNITNVFPKLDVFNFKFTKNKNVSKVKPSSLLPFKAFAHNIPSSLLSIVSPIYDDIV